MNHNFPPKIPYRDQCSNGSLPQIRAIQWIFRIVASMVLVCSSTGKYSWPRVQQKLKGGFWRHKSEMVLHCYTDFICGQNLSVSLKPPAFTIATNLEEAQKSKHISHHHLRWSFSHLPLLPCPHATIYLIPLCGPRMALGPILILGGWPCPDTAKHNASRLESKATLLVRMML